MSELTAGQPAESATSTFPNPLDVFGGDQLAKDRDDWLTLRAALRDIAKCYAPVDARGWPSEIHCDAKMVKQALESFRSGGRVSDEAEKLASSCKAYGNWQADVTWAECENAARLLGLVWCASTAEGIGERRQNADVRMMGVLFRKALRDWYRVDSWPDTYEARRLWAQQKTRRYDAMPRDWRGL